MTDHSTETLLVTGAGGNLGRLAVEELLARGAKRVIAGTRDLDAVADLVAKGAEARRVDFDDADLASALAGVDRMLLVSTVAPNRRAHQGHAVEAAKAAGVKHIVYTSAANPRPNASSAGIADHYWTEQTIAASGVGFTILRNHIYADIVPMGLEGAKATGQLFHAAGNKGRSYVTRHDAARTAAGALLTGENQEIHDVTGPAALTQTEVAQLLSRLAGREVAAVALDGEQLLQGLHAAGVPPFMAELLVAFDLDAADGHHAIVSDAVERFSGRKPASLATFLG